ncbi:MAG: winged helix-turn-helix domain-containing protein [Terriglobales bacterium]
MKSSLSMPQASQPGSPLLRFGVFEIDAAAGEMRKQGVRIKLQEQPFQVLVMLVETPGIVLSREEIRARLWGDDTFVDFDQSLNTAVNKIREALGDSATNPRYIETLARKGYRFLAPVERHNRAPSVETKFDSGTAVHSDLDVTLPKRTAMRGLFALIQLMYLVFYLEALFHLRGVENIGDASLSGWQSAALEAAVVMTSGIGIPLRCYLLSAVGLDYRRLGEKFRGLFPFLLVLDLIWAFAPFLLLPRIGFGATFAATAALLYVPFSERTLIRLAYPLD